MSDEASAKKADPVTHLDSTYETYLLTTSLTSLTVGKCCSTGKQCGGARICHSFKGPGFNISSILTYRALAF